MLFYLAILLLALAVQSWRAEKYRRGCATNIALLDQLAQRGVIAIDADGNAYVPRDVLDALRSRT